MVKNIIINVLLSWLNSHDAQISNIINRFSAISLIIIAGILVAYDSYKAYAMYCVVKQYLWPLAMMDINQPDIDSLTKLWQNIVLELLELI